MQDATKTLRQHTLSDIAAAAGVKKRAVQGWLAKAKEQHGEIGQITDGARHFSDAEKEQLLAYQVRKPTAVGEANDTDSITDDAAAAVNAITVVDTSAPTDYAPVPGMEALDLACIRQNLGIAPMTDSRGLQAQAAAAIAAMEALTLQSQMEVQQRRESLRNAQATAVQIQLAATRLQQQQQQLQIQATVASELEAMANQQTQQGLAYLQSLGKPAGSDAA